MSADLIKEARSLGYDITAGSKHWRLTHTITSTKGIIPFGRRISTRSIRNIRAHLRRGAQRFVSDGSFNRAVSFVNHDNSRAT